MIGDRLFANQTYMELVESYGFKYIFTLKNDSLKNPWKEIDRIRNSKDQLIEGAYEKTSDTVYVPKKGESDERFFRKYEWICELQHKENEFSWCSLKEYFNDDEEFYFSVITNLPPNKSNIFKIMYAARSRAAIEDGFNTMKNRGFKIKHKYSRKSDNAAMNYITLTCVADILSNLVFLSDFVQRTFFQSDKKAITSFIKELRSALSRFIGEKAISQFWEVIPQKTTYTMPQVI